MIIRDLLDNGIFLAKRLTEALEERVRDEVREIIASIINSRTSPSASATPSGLGRQQPERPQYRFIRQSA